MAEIKWNDSEFVTLCVKAGMDRMESAAHVIANDARRRLIGKVKDDWPEHGPYKRRYSKSKQRGGIVSYAGGGGGASWTARYHGDMAKTIRVVRKYGSSSQNIWIMAGNFNVWWATQLEYGRGSWRGKAKPFLRPALNAAPGNGEIKGILEGGAIGSEVI